jgi:uncharacterized protein (TIGR03435 family)
MGLRPLAPLAVVICAGVAISAHQRSPSPDPSFEVASIKPTANDAPEGISVQPDGVRFNGFQVRTLITIAYRAEGIQRFDQLVGAPSWTGVDRFDIVAKAGSGLAAQEPMTTRLPAMLRALLRERFRLRAHAETRSMPAFALRIARRDRRLGQQLRESTSDCSANGRAQAGQSDSDTWCGIRATGGVITGRSVSSAQLAGNLSGYPTIDRFVADRTGLTGRYDFRLEYSPAVVGGGDAAANPGPSLFTALTEQLGLRLQPEKAVLPVLVIDRVEKPTPD